MTDQCETLSRVAHLRGRSYARMAVPFLVDVIASNGIYTDAEKVGQTKALCERFFDLYNDMSIPWEVIPDSTTSTTCADAGNDIQPGARTASSSTRDDEGASSPIGPCSTD